MSIANPPPGGITREVLRSTVRTFAQGSAAQRAQAAAAASTRLAAGAALGEAFFVVYIGGIATGLVLSLQHRLALQTATQLKLDNEQKTRQNTSCIFTDVPLCPGSGTLEFDEVRDGLREIRDAIDENYQDASLVPSLPSWRPWARWWLHEMHDSFNRLEKLVEAGLVCKKEPEKVCRERMPAIKRVCVRRVPLQ